MRDKNAIKVPQSQKPKHVFVPMEKETTYDRILDHYVNGTALNPKDQEIAKRWFLIFAELCDGKSPMTVKRILEEQTGLSARQIERDFQDALLLHGDVQEVNKKAWRNILIEYQMQVLNYANDQQPKDMKAANEAIKNLIKITGLDKDDPEKIDWSSLEPHVIKFSINKKVELLIKHQIAQGSIDLDDAIDITDLQK